MLEIETVDYHTARRAVPDRHRGRGAAARRDDPRQAARRGASASTTCGGCSSTSRAATPTCTAASSPSRRTTAPTSASSSSTTPATRPRAATARSRSSRGRSSPDVLPVAGAETRVVVDVPSGRLETVARVRGRRRRVGALPQRAVLRAGAATWLPGVDVAFGGAFYASVEERVESGRAAATDRARARAQGRDRGGARGRPPARARAARRLRRDLLAARGRRTSQRNVTVFADGEVDRSPCGSGTSARLALLDASGELPRGQELRHLSIVGSEFRAPRRRRRRGRGPSGRRHRGRGQRAPDGRHRFVLEDADELGTGFLLR